MNTNNFYKLLLKTAFCCMVSDGKIDDKEISIIISMFEKSPLFSNFNFQEEVNSLISEINNRGKDFIKDYFDLLNQTQLSEEEELTLIDFAIRTINADEQIEYSEIKFFKNIRHRLKVSDEKILNRFPNIEMYLEKDIITNDFLDKITSQYFEISELPKFDLISFINKNRYNESSND